jgi:hypothetical protein
MQPSLTFRETMTPSCQSQKAGMSAPRAEWMKAVAARRGFNRTVIAVANKMARAARRYLCAGRPTRPLEPAQKISAQRAEPMRGA